MVIPNKVTTLVWLAASKHVGARLTENKLGLVLFSASVIVFVIVKKSYSSSFPKRWRQRQRFQTMTKTRTKKKTKSDLLIEICYCINLWPPFPYHRLLLNPSFKDFKMPHRLDRSLPILYNSLLQFHSHHRCAMELKFTAQQYKI